MTAQLTERLAPHHLASLRASGISDDLIESRGYFTARRKVELANLGFSERQRLVPALVVPVSGVHGEVALYQARPDTPRIRDGKVVKYETPAKTRMALDVPPPVRDLLRDPHAPLFVTEGVKKADALATRGRCAVALMGVWNFRGTNEHGGKTLLAAFESIALNDRDVFVVYDSDVAIKPGVAKAMARLGAVLDGRGAHTRYVYLPSGAAGEKVGVDDFLAQGNSVDALMALATNEVVDFGPEAAVAEPTASQADSLIAIGTEQYLFHDDKQTAFARVESGDHLETWPVRSRRFKLWLQHRYRSLHGKSVGQEGLNSALGGLEGIALFEGPQHVLSTRVASHEGAIWYDLGDAMWRAVRIEATGWEVVDRPPPIFRRFAHQQPQVIPERGGDLHRLFAFLNVRPESRVLLACWLVAAFVPDIPHPIPDFHGEKGAGKSVGQRVLRRLIDPSAAETLSFAGDRNEIVQQLSHHYCPLYDNVDRIPPWLSDLLCRAVTGEGSSKRELYSDDDDVIYAYRRVVLLNGVNIVSQRSDLLDRSVLVELERIDPSARREESEFWKDFEAARPLLMGAIFDTLSGAMAAYGRVRPARLPRMADFARWGAAIAEAMGLGAEQFASAYAANQRLQTREAVEGDVVGAAIVALMARQQEWRGTPTKLLEDLADAGENERLFGRTASRRVDARGWPQAPHALTARLTQLGSNLADQGIRVERLRGDTRTIVIRRVAHYGGEVGDGSDGDVLHPRSPDAPDAEIPTSQVLPACATGERSLSLCGGRESEPAIESGEL